MWEGRNEDLTVESVRRGLTTLSELPMWLNTISLAKALKLESALCVENSACMIISTTMRRGTEKFSEAMFATAKEDGPGDSLGYPRAQQRAVLATSFFDLEPSMTQNDGSVISIILHGRNLRGGDQDE